MNRIAEYRKKAGLTQEELADLCGWSGNGRISNYETGLRTPSTNDLNQIRIALHVKRVKVSLEVLAGLTEPKTA